MLAPAIARGVVEGGGRGGPAERPVIPDIGPDAAGDGLSCGQDRHRRIVAMQPFRRQDMGLDETVERYRGKHPGADLVGQRRDTEVDALALEALALAVQRNVLSELVEQDRRQQLWPNEAARRRVERRRRLRDRLAVPAGELLAHRLDHLPLARDYLQRLGDILAQLGQPAAAAAWTAPRRLDDYALALNGIGKGFAHRPLAPEGPHGLRPFRRRQLILRRGRLELLQLKLQLVQQTHRALRPRAVECAPQLLDLELEMRNQRFAAGQVRLRTGR